MNQNQQQQKEINRRDRAAAAKRSRSIPKRIEAMGRREDQSHAGHQRRGIDYQPTCAACQKRQLGPLADGQLHARTDNVHRVWHYPPCP